MKIKPLLRFAHHFAGPTLLFGIMLLLQPNTSQYAYDRESVENGDYWLLLSANFTHLNWTHFSLNLFGISLLTYLHWEHYLLKSFLPLILLCAFLVTCGLHWINTDISSYVGLSGVLHGLLAWGIAQDIGKGKALGWLLAIFLVLKLGLELFGIGSSTTTDMIDAPVITAAHLYGAIGGTIYYVLERVVKSPAIRNNVTSW